MQGNVLVSVPERRVHPDACLTSALTCLGTWHSGTVIDPIRYSFFSVRMNNAPSATAGEASDISFSGFCATSL